MCERSTHSPRASLNEELRSRLMKVKVGSEEDLRRQRGTELVEAHCWRKGSQAGAQGRRHRHRGDDAGGGPVLRGAAAMAEKRDVLYGWWYPSPSVSQSRDSSQQRNNNNRLSDDNSDG